MITADRALSLLLGHVKRAVREARRQHLLQISGQHDAVRESLRVVDADVEGAIDRRDAGCLCIPDERQRNHDP